MKKYPYVILGGSIAAVAAIEGIRSTVSKGEILVGGDEPCKAYGRPLRPYCLLRGTALQGRDYRPATIYNTTNLRLRPAARERRINTQ